jgi:hypothetical protein
LQPPRLKSLLPAILASLALVAAGCNAGAAAGPPLTADEFIVQGDEICAAAAEQRAKEASDWFGRDPEPSVADRQAFIAEVVGPNYRRQVEQLRRLTPPPGDEAQIEQILVGLEHVAEVAEQEPGDMLKAGSDARAAKLAAAYGFMACGV